MQKVVIPSDGKIFIATVGDLVIVSRFVETDPETYTVQPARNWQALEPVARRAVAQFRAAGWSGSWYPCPLLVSFGASFSNEVDA